MLLTFLTELEKMIYEKKMRSCHVDTVHILSVVKSMSQ